MILLFTKTRISPKISDFFKFFSILESLNLLKLLDLTRQNSCNCNYKLIKLYIKIFKY